VVHTNVHDLIAHLAPNMLTENPGDGDTPEKLLALVIERSIEPPGSE